MKARRVGGGRAKFDPDARESRSGRSGSTR